MEILKDSSFQKRFLYLNASLPMLFLLVDWNTERLGANPPEAFIRSTGVIAILFLVLTLLVTPCASLLKWSWLVKHRRWLGLTSFYYACAHLIAYAIFDKGLNLQRIFTDIGKRPFILLGFSALLLMIPLAITSTNTMIKKLGGKNWKRLHKATYLIAPLAAIHYWLIVKSDLFYPIIFAFSIAALLLYRSRNLLRLNSRQTKGPDSTV